MIATNAYLYVLCRMPPRRQLSRIAVGPILSGNWDQAVGIIPPADSVEFLQFFDSSQMKGCDVKEGFSGTNDVVFKPGRFFQVYHATLSGFLTRDESVPDQYICQALLEIVGDLHQQQRSVIKDILFSIMQVLLKHKLYIAELIDSADFSGFGHLNLSCYHAGFARWRRQSTG